MSDKPIFSLFNTSESMRVTSDATATTTEPTSTCFWHDVYSRDKPDTQEYPRGRTTTALAGTAEVVICTAPSAQYFRHGDRLYIYNGDTVAHVITVFLDDGTNRNIFNETLQPGDTLVWE